MTFAERVTILGISSVKRSPVIRLDGPETLSAPRMSPSGPEIGAATHLSPCHEEMIERVVRTVEANTKGSGPDAIDAAHIRVILCANSDYPLEQVNQAIATALEQGRLIEHDEEDGYIVAQRHSGDFS